MTITRDRHNKRIDFTISMPVFDFTVNILLSAGELTEQERAAFENAEMEYEDEMDFQDADCPSTCGYMKMPILADGLEALKKDGSTVGALTTFHMQYPFERRMPSTRHQQEPGCIETSPDKDREGEAAWLKNIVEIVQREEMIQELVQEQNGEVAGLRRRSRRMGQSGENPDSNAWTNILCRFPDEATRDRVANEVVQRCQSFNVTVVDTTEEDWWE